ncbi:MAG: LamG domain-containing protein, partial [Verrucomicrobiota bacterium]
SDALPFSRPTPMGRWRSITRLAEQYPLRIAAVILVLATALPLWWSQFRSAPPELMMPGGLAVINRLVDPVWVGQEYGEGETLRPGDFALSSGLAQIEFFSGASVIVEGPAHLRLKSAWEASCLEGRLHVSVPEPAQGFTLETSDFRAVDLGTEFTLAVGADGESDVRVIDGEVRIDPLAGNSTPPRVLTTGLGLRSSDPSPYPLGAGTNFIDSQLLLSRAQDDEHHRYAAWLQSRLLLRSHPHLIALFTFDDQKPWERQLLNQKGDGPQAAIIGASWSEGRWKGKGALSFRRVSDRVRLSIPGEFSALTLCASVRIRSFDRWLSALLLTDGFEEGEVHWQISDEGELILGIAGAQPLNSTSPRIISPSDLGKWLHLAVTVDLPTKTVCHYLNGLRVSEEQKSVLPEVLRIGQAEIGNWQSQARSHPIRSFNGSMEELLVFDRALSEKEIRDLAIP